ncbi:prostacyclin synthase-like [Acipenser oxyrinchus oxyrinchus]|uniref:Prostacyclin synthase n=1 Tax=Acipenser oxyrinchus oxyrinchus TaxID=40147 RepID=A0AAD8CU37_ACIOX|nr:prostacyclin synthase-like [Acipenser oxyrinchus oxyrinchus]
MYVLMFCIYCRLVKEPPLDKGCIPWLGHALEFGKDAAKFLSRMKNKHGDIFTVRVAGRYVTVLLDPKSYDAVIKESGSKFNFSKYACLLMERIFNLRLPDYEPNTEKAMMKLHFQGKPLHSLSTMMQSNLDTVLLPESNDLRRTWRRDGLFNFCYSALFRAGYLTLYGNESEQGGDQAEKSRDRSQSADIYREFRKFDKLLMKIARTTLTSAEKKEAQGVKEILWELLSTMKLVSKLNRSSWLESYRRHLVEKGLDEEMQSRAMLLQLWATQGNAGPAAFWLLVFLLKNPEAMSALKNEFNKILQGQRLHPPPHSVTQEMLNNTPVFDSMLCETLRLTAAPFITREILQDMPLCLADGRQYNIRKGDRICLFPYLSPQMDHEIHQEPQKFKYDRFLNPDGTEKKDFYKDGSKLKYYNMPWGAGSHMCVGRFFAINSIKQFLFMVLTSFELELCDPEAAIPDIDVSRYGFGMLQPKRDVEIQYRLRDFEHSTA